jgi:hypothetical protein
MILDVPEHQTALQFRSARGTFATDLQLGASRAYRSAGSDLLPQRPAPFSAGKLALSFAVEARFISIDG